MLLCVNQEKNIKVFRVTQGADGPPTRERLGVISKKDFQLNGEFSGLPADELEELNTALDVYKRANRVRKHAQVLAFPEVLREVLEYLETGEADEAERKHVFVALMEGVRHMRKMNAPS